MITKDVALEKIRAIEAKTVKDGLSEAARSTKNEYYDTLVRVINAINPEDTETIDNIVHLGGIIKEFSEYVLEESMSDDDMRKWFDVLYLILDRVLIEARPLSNVKDSGPSVWAEKLEGLTSDLPESLNYF